MFFSFYAPKDFSFFTTIGILSHKAARHSTDQSSRSSSDISALPTIDDSTKISMASTLMLTSTIAGCRVEHFVVGQEIDGFVIFGIRQYHPAT